MSSGVRFHVTDSSAVELQSIQPEVGSGAVALSEDEEARVALLLSAAAKNNVNKVEALLKAGMSADSSDYDKRSALHLAASEGHLEVVKLLHLSACSASPKDRFSNTPLDDAVRNGHTEVADFLRSIGAKHGTLDKFEADLIQAACENNIEEAKRLMKNGVSAKCCDYDKRTPLHLAVAEGHIEMCKLLLENGADSSAEDRWGLTPIYEANRRATRTGADPIKELFKKSSDHENHEVGDFAWLFGFWELAMIILFGILVDYNNLANGNADPTLGADDMHNSYPLFQDVHVMIFIGFGFLMTFLRKHGYNSLGMTMLLATFTIQWYTLTAGFWHGVFKNHFARIRLTILDLIKADFCAGSVLITYGAILGKVSPFQLMVITIIEPIFFALNEAICLHLGVADIGGTHVIHMFGAYFGLACSLFVTSKQASGNNNNSAVYHSDMFAMVGTIFLWLFWPSFNAALSVGGLQQRCVINTVLALSGCCVSAFIASYIYRGENKFNMVDVQNATLAGGVAIGAVADMLVKPGAAIAIGAIAGFLSVYGYVYIQPYLEKKIGLHDTCGVNNLHGMPSILGGFAAVIASSAASLDTYGADQLYFIFTSRETRTANRQASVQFAFMCITFGIAIASGAITGWFVKCKIFSPRQDKELFVDEQDWEVPELEVPYYFDHRGEITRDGNKLGRAQDGVEAPVLDQTDRIEALEKQVQRIALSSSASKLESVFDKLLTKLEKSA